MGTWICETVLGQEQEYNIAYYPGIIFIKYFGKDFIIQTETLEEYRNDMNLVSWLVSTPFPPTFVLYNNIWSQEMCVII